MDLDPAPPNPAPSPVPVASTRQEPDYHLHLRSSIIVNLAARLPRSDFLGPPPSAFLECSSVLDVDPW
ncbi:hypothetical protein EVJ58_g7319 [Rhodofomes roseus]|uniref:Uncharacterized protein n=1 Tax=Rhodofomes roseus TaxID=34475 RepID=A0A4Y9Y441_9APHY|nr:hypothetical protein EVJ58_g7319 [Rhodofomes roseus]